jgi:hypothetical protein
MFRADKEKFWGKKSPVEDGNSEAITLILCHMCGASSVGNIYCDVLPEGRKIGTAIARQRLH